ncbi:hypothetical protein H6501_03320 [Candidatus Woesearchaeota archaeon]|nr:hypothetical protein [Candidatus Woesearchaeota archaeon]USN43680.1 MAG: hypothetical protein H6500_04805 [Candidatus Woesearchaeota archaeon]
MANTIFGGGDKNNEVYEQKFSSQSKTLLKLIERQKEAENSLDLLGEKLELLDHNSVKNFKKAFSDIKVLGEELRDLREAFEKQGEFNTKVKRQLSLMASTDDVSHLEKYIELWNPMDFVTRQEIDELRAKIKDDLVEIIEKFMKD